jgi:hypothetical protein
MFEQEIEMEKKEGSSFGPILVVLLFVGLFVGGIGIVIFQSRQTLKPEEATAALDAKMKSAPVTVTFHTGKVSYAAADKPNDPQYLLFEKAGILKVTKITKGTDFAAQVDLTPAGKELLASLPNVKGVPDKDNTTGYTLPLASRKLVSVDKITKLNRHKYQVQYTWTWQTTKVGDMFDIAGKLVQELPSYDRSLLIDKHGANFYHGAPSQSTILLTKEDTGWQPFSD